MFQHNSTWPKKVILIILILGITVGVPFFLVFTIAVFTVWCKIQLQEIKTFPQFNFAQPAGKEATQELLYLTWMTENLHRKF